MKSKHSNGGSRRSWQWIRPDDKQPAASGRLTAMVVVVTLMLIGCGRSWRQGPLQNEVERDVRVSARHDPNERPAAPAASPDAKPSDGGHRPNVDIPEGAGCQTYVDMALRRNPAIRAAQQKISRLAERIPQVTSLDDPMFAVAPVGEMTETAAGMVGLMAGISQKLPFPGKLETRGRIAGQAVAMAAQDLEHVRLQVAADIRRAYWSHYHAARAIEVTERSRALLGRFRKIAETKNKAGSATQQDVLRASVELSNLDSELIMWRQRLDTAAGMINSLIDRSVTAAVPLPQTLTLDRISLELDALLDRAGKINPTMRKVRERIEAYRQRLGLARLDRIPDLTAMVNYAAVEDDGLSVAANGDDQWWFGIGVNLPIWFARLDAAEQEARRGIFEGLADLSGAQNRVAFRVQDAYLKVDAQQRLVILLRDVIVPQARQTVDASFSGYRAGRLGFLPLVDNWRKLLNFRLMHHQSLAQFEKDFAQLQEAVGEDLLRAPGGALEDVSKNAITDPRP
jgi:cobalt-zinc-cadmium efflux system outer membrane protein